MQFNVIQIHQYSIYFRNADASIGKIEKGMENLAGLKHNPYYPSRIILF